jgi:hypothetical protein
VAAGGAAVGAPLHEAELDLVLDPRADDVAARDGAAAVDRRHLAPQLGERPDDLVVVRVELAEVEAGCRHGRTS